MEGLQATRTDGVADHKTRIEYLKLAIEMNCWSAADRMRIRTHIREIRRDAMEHEYRMKSLGLGAMGPRISISPEARREMG